MIQDLMISDPVLDKQAPLLVQVEDLLVTAKVHESFGQITVQIPNKTITSRQFQLPIFQLFTIQHLNQTYS